MIHNPITERQVALISDLLNERLFTQTNADEVSERVRYDTEGPYMINSQIDINNLGTLTSFEAHFLIRRLLAAPGKDGRKVHRGDGQ